MGLGGEMHFVITACWLQPRQEEEVLGLSRLSNACVGVEVDIVDSPSSLSPCPHPTHFLLHSPLHCQHSCWCSVLFLVVFNALFCVATLSGNNPKIKPPPSHSPRGVSKCVQGTTWQRLCCGIFGPQIVFLGVCVCVRLIVFCVLCVVLWAGLIKIDWSK